MRDARKVTVGLVAVIALALLTYGLWRGEMTWPILAMVLLGIIPLVLKTPRS